MSEVSKSSQAFRTISEVSEELGVPQHVLRFWETKFSSIRPMKRGGNRRYYRPEDVQMLQAINKLLYVDGYTIRGVQKLIRDKGIREIAAHHGSALPVESGSNGRSAAEPIVVENAGPSRAAAPSHPSPVLEAEVTNTAKLEFEPDPSIEQPTLFMPMPQRAEPSADVVDAIAKLNRVRASIQSALEKAG